MSNHQVIARKWRPQKFGDVVGQTHVIRTLRNAISGNRIGHAYLLVGPRGIGKTTIARIFAKAINCENPLDGEPCCQCASCRALADESSLDVIEIDAASRNSVEHMRALSEEAYHMPVASKYKIYIIDEVHMLSKAAWNALLKTVEEPPSHVKFIFATTEAHLVLPTIVSRCQRFDLRPIAGNLILSRLKLIAETENVKIAPEALSAIARAAEGGMRDAQSSLEQMLAFFGGRDQEIAAEQVLELFGLTNAVELDTLLAAMLQNQPGPVVTIINQLAGRGRNLETLFDDILEMLRGAELMQLLNHPETVLDFEEEKLARCRKLAQLTNAEVLRSFMETLTPVGRILHEALNKAIYLESILLKAMHEAHAPTVGDVLARLQQLRTADELKFIEQVPSFQQQPRPAAIPVILPETATATTRSPEPPAPQVESNEAVEPAISTPEPAPDSAPAPDPTASSAPVTEPESHPVEATAVAEPTPEPQLQAVSAPAETAMSNPGTAVPAAAAAGQEHEVMWQQLLAMAADTPLLETLHACQPLSLINSVLSVQIPSAALPELQANRIKLLSWLQKISGNWAILLDFQPDKTVAATPPAAESTAQASVPQADTVEEFIEITPEMPTEEPGDYLPADYQEMEISAAAPPENFSGSSNSDLPAEEILDMAEDYTDIDHAAAISNTVEPEYIYSKRSVINKPDEVEATAKLPPVQKVLDLFGGEIVDIHA